MTADEKLKEIQKILGKLVKETEKVKKIQDNSKKDSWMWWNCKGALLAYEYAILHLTPYFTPDSIPEGVKIKIDSKGNVKRHRT